MNTQAKKKKTYYKIIKQQILKTLLTQTIHRTLGLHILNYHKSPVQVKTSNIWNAKFLTNDNQIQQLKIQLTENRKAENLKKKKNGVKDYT